MCTLCFTAQRSIYFLGSAMNRKEARDVSRNSTSLLHSGSVSERNVSLGKRERSGRCCMSATVQQQCIAVYYSKSKRIFMRVRRSKLHASPLRHISLET